MAADRTFLEAPKNFLTKQHHDLKDLLGVCWPAEGVLGKALQWAVTTTDAEPKFHMAAWLPLWAHECTVQRFNPCHEDAFRLFTFIYGQPAASKSTAWRRAADTFNTYRSGSSMAQIGGILNANGTESGLFAAVHDKMVLEMGIAPACFFQEEAASILTQDRIVEFFIQIFDGVTIERHQRSIQAANAARKDSIPAKLENHVVSMCMITTFRGISTIIERSPSLFDGGLGTRALHFVGSQNPKHNARYDAKITERKTVLTEWESWLGWARAQTLVQETAGTWHSSIETQLGDKMLDIRDDMLFGSLAAEQDPVLAATMKRGLTSVMTIAQLFALNARRTEVHPVDMMQACRLVQLCNRDVVRLLPRMDGHNPLAVPTAKALDAIIRAGTEGLPKSAFYTLLKRPKRIVQEILDTLEDADLVLPEHRANKAKRAGRVPTYYVAAQFRDPSKDPAATPAPAQPSQ